MSNRRIVTFADGSEKHFSDDIELVKFLLFVVPKSKVPVTSSPGIPADNPMVIPYLNIRARMIRARAKKVTLANLEDFDDKIPF